ncbi:hypothetical protein [Lysinibacillus sp. NPDC093216]|uniref:hypothetical protein n=1 Tax=Lysinibacillus sp. NPDC093216 TaxID=3390576 RepID=UPI003D015675
MEIPKPKNPGEIKFSADDKYLFIKRTTGTVYVYETTEFSLVAIFQSNKAIHLTEGNFALTTNPFIILDEIRIKADIQLASINTENGEINVLTNFEEPIRYMRYHHHIQSENAHLFTIAFENELYDELKVLKVTEKNGTFYTSLISFPDELFWDTLIYNPVYQVYILVEKYNLIIVNAEFNKILMRKNLLKDEKLDDIGYFTHIHLSDNGLFIVLAYSKKVLIVRSDDLQVILVETFSYACFAEFSKNDELLLIGTWSNGYVLETNLK